MYKEKVLKSSLISAIRYGCEAGFSENIRPLNTLYLSSVKAILGVRQITPNVLCLVESSFPTLEIFVKELQSSF